MIPNGNIGSVPGANKFLAGTSHGSSKNKGDQNVVARFEGDYRRDTVQLAFPR